MAELIKQTLKEYFAEYQKYHLLILILFTVIIALIQILQSVWVSNKIERFRNVLKKSEIKFSRYTNLQVDALKKTTSYIFLHNERLFIFSITMTHVRPFIKL